MATHYNSKSRGPVEIAAMNYNHLLNARDVLARSGDDGRLDELAAINSRIDVLDAEFQAEQATQPGAA